jgi:hypothetical protein
MYFHDRLNSLLGESGVDSFVERHCEPHYQQAGRSSIPPGLYFLMRFIGYFEEINSQRGVAWRCAESLSLRKLLGIAISDSTPDHSSPTKEGRKHFTATKHAGNAARKPPCKSVCASLCSETSLTSARQQDHGVHGLVVWTTTKNEIWSHWLVVISRSLCAACSDSKHPRPSPLHPSCYRGDPTASQTHLKVYSPPTSHRGLKRPIFIPADPQLMNHRFSTGCCWSHTHTHRALEIQPAHDGRTCRNQKK